MVNETTVHTGLWKNRQLPPSEAATLTLNAQDASYVVAFLALFLGVVASHFWAILSYAVFQARSTLEVRNGQHHQQQAILRNFHTPGAAVWQVGVSSWSWQQRDGLRAYVAAVPVVLLASSNVVAFAAAGILSARGKGLL